MFLVFGNDTEQANFLIGVVTGQKAVDIATWMAASPSGNMIISGIPIISFSSEVAENRNDQTSIWRIGSLHLQTDIESKWTWAQVPVNFLPGSSE